MGVGDVHRLSEIGAEQGEARHTRSRKGSAGRNRWRSTARVRRADHLGMSTPPLGKALWITGQTGRHPHRPEPISRPAAMSAHYP